MKKTLKITLISLLTLIVVVVIAITAVVHLVFSREGLTKFVQDHAEEYVTCPLEIDHVELTFFSSFPDFCVHVSNISLVNPMEGSINDTLLHVDDLYAQIDVKDYLDNNKVSVTAFRLERGRVNVYVNEQGENNFEVCPMLFGETDTTAVVDTTSSMILDKIKLEGISIADFSATFLDRQYNLEARVADLDAVLETDAAILELKGDADLSVHAKEIFYSDSLNMARIEDFHFDNCKLWSNGKDATLKLELLKAATQEYLLSGDTGLMAQIWDFNLHDIDLAWQDGKPSVEVLTELDSAAVSVVSDDLLNVTVGRSAIMAPVTSNDSVWSVDVKTRVEHLNVVMESEGTLIADRLFDTHFKTSTNTTFNDFHVWDMQTSLGEQTLYGEVHYNMTDTTNQVGKVVMQLKETTLKDLLSLVPASYLTSLEGMQVDALLKETRIGADLALKNGEFLLKKVKVDGKVNDFSYSDVDNLMAGADAVNYSVVYPNNLRRPYADVDFSANRFTAGMDDTIRVNLDKARGNVLADFDNYGNRIKVQSKAQVDELSLAAGEGIKGATGAAKVRLDAMYDDRKEDVLEMLSPDLDVDVADAKFEIADIAYPIELPRLDFSFSNNLFDVRQSELVIGNSSLSLKGTLNNLADYLADKAMLEGRFDLGGPLVDADQLMEMVSGLGADSTEVADATVAVSDSTVAENTAVADAEPFMVPKGVDFVLNTHVDKIQALGNAFNEVAGVVTCRDGVLVLDSVGFVSNAARMQLTALYKSPRKNNLFVGWNFHLLDIDIAEMINLVPEIDTIAPMVKAFAGKAQFHLAGQTNLFADYSPKMSTLKMAAAVEGKDLTVLDNETFQSIKKYLFKDCATNKIDSISVEATIARKKLNLFPMRVTWDRYEAVISGVHSVVNSMPFNYHISITKCPAVGGHLGLNVSGNMDDLDNIAFDMVGCKYANLYKPEKQNVTQAHLLELKDLINTSLKATVK